MSTMSLLRHSVVCRRQQVPEMSPKVESLCLSLKSSASFCTGNLNFNPLKARTFNQLKSVDNFVVFSSGNGNNGSGENGDGGGNDGGRNGDDEGGSDDSFGILGFFVNGWRSRVAADPQFPFKVLMEEIVGVSACIVGDMAGRPNFGLNELDLVFSTLVVGSIVNFLLMYLLAPTVSSTATASTLPAIFASCPSSHMFQPGTFTLTERFGTFVFKGIMFAAVGFAAGLVGTAISNGLISFKKKIDPNFETPNKPPPTLLNAMTWAAHMGFSSNFRYQALNGVEFLSEKMFPPFLFKGSVLVMRMLNNVVGGVTFVMLARLTGSQNVADKETVNVKETTSVVENEKLLDETCDGGNGKSHSD